jgi:predicted Zn-dependent protease
MPDKPTWCGHLDDVARRLRHLPDRWVDRATLEELLRIGPRRAQQILAPCVDRQIGASGVADREVVIAHLERLAAGESPHYERRRRQRLAEYMEALERERRQAVLVAAPAGIVNQKLEGLPEGVSILPGHISVRFDGTTDALRKLLALAMAIRNDELLFERMATGAK